MSMKKELYLICQNIRSLYNVGALFRCADVFGVTKVYLCGYTGFPPRKEISKTALGAENWILWERQWQTHVLIKRLKADGVRIVALETPSAGLRTRFLFKPLPTYKPTFPLALVVGSEVSGVSQKIMALADDVVQIPMLGKKESLNVAVAAAVALYTLRYHL